ncbi:MAG: GAF domain-containing protein [Bacteroidetes bacterium]|nr:GAF domain-containing protein [Bacteroidota bacterium]
MAESITVSGFTKKEQYESLIPQIQALIEGESDSIANLSNIISALKYSMGFFWVGIYFVKGASTAASSSLEETDKSLKHEELVLGPFQGPVACTRIAYGKGVCGKCWELKKTIIVKDVDQFPGHITCSTLSRSEIVLPAFNGKGEVFLVLDIDSEHLDNFNEIDKTYLERVMEIITKCAVLPVL